MHGKQKSDVIVHMKRTSCMHTCARLEFQKSAAAKLTHQNRTSIFPRFPGWLFWALPTPRNPGKRGNSGSDLRGHRSLGRCSEDCAFSCRAVGTIGRTFRQNIWQNIWAEHFGSSQYCKSRCEKKATTGSHAVHACIV